MYKFENFTVSQWHFYFKKSSNKSDWDYSFHFLGACSLLTQQEPLFSIWRIVCVAGGWGLLLVLFVSWIYQSNLLTQPPREGSELLYPLPNMAHWNFVHQTWGRHVNIVVQRLQAWFVGGKYTLTVATGHNCLKEKGTFSLPELIKGLFIRLEFPCLLTEKLPCRSLTGLIVEYCVVRLNEYCPKMERLIILVLKGSGVLGRLVWRSRWSRSAGVVDWYMVLKPKCD